MISVNYDSKMLMHKLFIRVIIRLQLIGAGHSRGSPKLLACCYIIFGKGNSNLAFEWGKERAKRKVNKK